MIDRQMSNQILEAATQYPAVAVTGPRQSGKTTLCRELFPDYAYANLEKPETRRFAAEDPNGFLAQFGKPVILDEVQLVPDLFSYIMPLVDEHRKMGEFVLSGSQNFHLQQAIRQSLAGRCANLKLLPLSFRELSGKPGAGLRSDKQYGSCIVLSSIDRGRRTSDDEYQQIFCDWVYYLP